jgi:peptidyl-prolyl cis-trans isomerase D
MISAIQNKLQKHNKVVFFVLLAVIIVAFVFTIGAAPGLGGDQSTARDEFFGYNMQSQRDRQEITRLGLASYRLQHGDGEVDGNRIDNYLIERIAYLGLADKLRIPSPTDDQFWQFLGRQSAFQNESGRFDRAKFDFFMDEVEADPRLSQGDIALVVDQDFRIERARQLLSGPGFSLPTEVRLQLEREQTLWSIEFAQIDLSGFDPEIEISEEDLVDFFESNDFRYERSPRVSFSYATFKPESFLDRVGEVSETELQRHFDQNRSRFTPPAPMTEEGEEPAETPEVTLADVRDQVEAAVRLQKARRIAGNAAADFAVDLFREGVLPSDSAFTGILERHRGDLQEAPLASRDNFPPELGFSRQIQERVFTLGEDRKFSTDPVETRNQYIILIHNETLPAYIPPLDEVRTAVQRDFESQERRRLLSLRGEEIRQSLSDRMADGSSFLEAAEAEELETTSVEKFARTPPFPPELPQQVIGRLDDFKKGQVSPMVSVQGTGYFVLVTNLDIPEIDVTNEEFVQTRERMQMFSTMANQFAVLQEFIEREASSSAKSR